MGGGPGRRLVGDRYELTDLLGVGGEGEVWRGVDRMCGEAVAVKRFGCRLSPDAVERLRARVGVRPHPAVVECRDLVDAEGASWLVMDLVDGPTLASVLAHRGAPGLPFTETLAVLAPVAAALDALRELNEGHGDVTAQNIVLGPAGPMLVDASPRVTATGGTDVGQLAALAFELLTGSPVTPGLGASVPGLHPALEQRVSAGLAAGLSLDPRRRPSTAAELVGLLRGTTHAQVPTGDVFGRVVGRDDVLDQAQRLLTDPGSPGLVVTGGPGLGKSHLMRTLRGRLEAAGVDHLAISGDASTSRWPVVAFGPLLHRLGTDMSDDRDSVISAVTGLVESMTGSAPIVLLVDDAHWVDPESAVVIYRLVVRGRARAVIASRTLDGLPPALAELVRGRSLPTETLELLGPGDTEALASALLGGDLHPALARELYRVTSGNPQVLREVVADATATGAVRREAGRHQLARPLLAGRSLTAVVADRVSRLPDGQVRVLAALALVAGLSSELVRSVADDGDLRALVDSGLVAVDPDSGLARLAHPVHRDAVRQVIDPRLRRECARRLVDAMTTVEPSHRAELLVRCTLELEAGLPGDPAQLAAAARYLAASSDHEDAVTLALAALDHGPDPIAAVALTDALLLAGADLDLAARHLQAALEYSGDESEGLVVLDRLASALSWGLLDHDRALAAIAEYESRASKDAVVAGSIAAVRVRTLIQKGDVGAAIGTGRAALVNDRTPGPARAELLGHLGGALATAGFIGEALDQTTAALELALSVVEESPSTFGRVAQNHLFALFAAGQVETAEMILLGSHSMATLDFVEPSRATAAAALGRIAVGRGMSLTALRWLEEAEALVSVSDPDRVYGWVLSNLAVAHVRLGDHDAARAALRRTAGRLHVTNAITHTDHLLACALVDAVDDGPASAAAHLADTAVDEFAAGRTATGCFLLYEAFRIEPDCPGSKALVDAVDGLDFPLGRAYADHFAAFHERDPAGLTDAAERLMGLGSRLPAAEAFAQAGETDRARAVVALCEGAVTPALTRAGVV